MSNPPDINEIYDLNKPKWDSDKLSQIKLEEYMNCIDPNQFDLLGQEKYIVDLLYQLRHTNIYNVVWNPPPRKPPRNLFIYDEIVKEDAPLTELIPNTVSKDIPNWDLTQAQLNILFIRACAQGNGYAMVLALQYGADPRTVFEQDGSGATAIHMIVKSKASIKDKLSMIKILKSDLSLNAVDGKGRTALHYCARQSGSGNLTLMRSLCKMGSDPTIRDNYRETPQETASRCMNVNSRDLLATMVLAYNNSTRHDRSKALRVSPHIDYKARFKEREENLQHIRSIKTSYGQ